MQQLRPITLFQSRVRIQKVERLGEGAWGGGDRPDNERHKSIDRTRKEKKTSPTNQLELTINNPTDSCLELGICYEYGNGRPKNTPKATRQYVAACDLGLGQGCAFAGNMHAWGLGVDQDFEQAVDFYRTGCEELESTAACIAWGNTYERGNGIEQDMQRAVELYAGACQVGDMEGCVAEGVIYVIGGLGESDFGAAAERFTLACESDYGRGCTYLGALHLGGQGVSLDKSQGAELVERGCLMGHSDGCLHAGYLFVEGSGVKRNKGAAYSFFELGCAGGNDEACMALNSSWRSLKRQVR